METKKRGRTENLKPWKPGQSGNPGGRPKRKPITDRYLKKLEEKIPGDPKGRTYGDALVQAMMREAIKGKVPAANEIADRVEGKPTTTIAAEDATLENLPELIAAARKRVHDGGGLEAASYLGKSVASAPKDRIDPLTSPR